MFTVTHLRLGGKHTLHCCTSSHKFRTEKAFQHIKLQHQGLFPADLNRNRVPSATWTVHSQPHLLVPPLCLTVTFSDKIPPCKPWSKVINKLVPCFYVRNDCQTVVHVHVLFYRGEYIWLVASIEIAGSLTQAQSCCNKNFIEEKIRRTSFNLKHKRKERNKVRNINNQYNGKIVFLQVSVFIIGHLPLVLNVPTHISSEYEN